MHVYVRRKWLENYMDRNNLKRLDMASIMQVSESTISMWLKGRRTIGPERRKKLQRILKMDWDEIFEKEIK